MRHGFVDNLVFGAGQQRDLRRSSWHTSPSPSVSLPLSLALPPPPSLPLRPPLLSSALLSSLSLSPFLPSSLPSLSLPPRDLLYLLHCDSNGPFFRRFTTEETCSLRSSYIDHKATSKTHELASGLFATPNRGGLRKARRSTNGLKNTTARQPSATAGQRGENHADKVRQNKAQQKDWNLIT